MKNPQQYLESRKSLIRVICRSQQWSGIDEKTIYKWLDNFQSSFGRYLALKILLHSIYYSEHNIFELLRYGIYELIHSSKIRRDLVNRGDIFAPNHMISAQLNSAVGHSIFVPVLDKNRPGESANLISRYLIHKVGIDARRSVFLSDVKVAQLSPKNTIVFVDDSIGSGVQASLYFQKKEVRDFVSEAKLRGVPIHFLVLTAYQRSLIALQSSINFQSIEIVACATLQESDRVFDISNPIWNNDLDEYSEAVKYFDDLSSSTGIKTKGYEGLDFAVIFHQTVPDWSLPIFYHESSDWTPLIRRKSHA